MRDLECNWSVQVHSAARYDDTIYRAVLAQWGGKRNLAWWSITCYNTAILSVTDFTDAFPFVKVKTSCCPWQDDFRFLLLVFKLRSL